MRQLRVLLVGALLILCGAATAFFLFFGVRIVYAVLTFDGEGSLGHVGLVIAAGLYPLLALFFGSCTYLAWRQLKRPSLQ